MGIIIIIIGALLGMTLLLVKKAEAETVTTTTPHDPESVDAIIIENAKRYSIDAALIRAVIRQESNFDAEAVNPSDPSYGLMQITPILAEDYGLVKDWHNPTEAEIAMIKIPSTNVRIGSWFLSKLLSKYTMDMAIQMFNLGESGYNSGYRAPEYLAKVKGYYNEYKPH
jgi:soluble lytic murein transglycosylase-like protein